MKEFQQRVVDEKSELDDKLGKLTRFIGTGSFNKLSMNEQRRMERQREIMMQYSHILGERIYEF